MERTLIGELGERIGQSVSISGWVDVARNQGKMAFFDFRDRSGVVQGVVFGKPEVLEIAQDLKQEWVVRIEGVVNERPEKMRRDVQNGNIELEITAIEVLAKAESMPFDMDAELNLDTELDHRPLTLRREREHMVFAVQATILHAYRHSLREQGFTEFQAPALAAEDAEGGSAVFKVNYFNDKTAYLATSPQLYKQIMVGAFERVSTIAKIFRAEKSATTRHLAEITQMDFEMGFIETEEDVMRVLETTVRDTVTEVLKKHGDNFAKLSIEQPLLGEQPFPRYTLAEVIDAFDAEQGVVSEDKDDLTPEQERWICAKAKEEQGSDFVFITRFPTDARAFYTYEDPAEAPSSRAFDLLFRGLEINSGAQRIHNYDELVRRIEARGMNPEKFEFYLQAFKYGMPPHGGCSTGLERFTMKMLNLENVKEAVPFPRDMNRIDTLLSASEDSDESHE